LSIRITPRTTRLWALPAKQARSRVTRDRLLVAGRQLLEQGVFEQTTIAGLAQIAGCSVGSFYSRFPDKEAFYQAVMVAYRGLTSTVQHKSMRDTPAIQTLQRIGLRSVPG
jgi:AcrR family transcriptional regulator